MNLLKFVNLLDKMSIQGNVCLRLVEMLSPQVKLDVIELHVKNNAPILAQFVEGRSRSTLMSIGYNYNVVNNQGYTFYCTHENRDEVRNTFSKHELTVKEAMRRYGYLMPQEQEFNCLQLAEVLNLKCPNDKSVQYIIQALLFNAASTYYNSPTGAYPTAKTFAEWKR